MGSLCVCLPGDAWASIVVDRLDSGWEALVMFVPFWMLSHFMLAQVFVSIAFAAYGEAVRYVSVYALTDALVTLRTLFAEESASARGVAEGDVSTQVLLETTPIEPGVLLYILSRVPRPLYVPLRGSKYATEYFFFKHDIPVSAEGVYYLDVLSAVCAADTGMAISLPEGVVTARGGEDSVTMLDLVKRGAILPSVPMSVGEGDGGDETDYDDETTMSTRYDVDESGCGSESYDSEYSS